MQAIVKPRISTAITLTGAKAHLWLQHSRRGRVAAVHKQCLYLADHHDALICLGSRRLGPGPINALCDADWEHTEALRAGDVWQRQDGVLHVGAEQCFRIDDPIVWRPAPAKGPWNAKATGDRLHRARVYLSSIDAGPLIPLLLENVAPRSSRLRTAFEQQAGSAIRALSRWLDDTLADFRSAKAIPERVVNLIGLGPGLTPSGDDFLGGALVALRTLEHHAAADRVAAWIKRNAPALTNSISLAHLSAACDGEALEPVHQALNAILDGNGDDIEATLAALSAVGHSSGFDAFGGVLAVLEKGTHLFSTPKK